MIDTIGHEVTRTFELELFFRLGFGQCRFNVTRDNFEAVGVQQRTIVGVDGIGLCHSEESIVEAQYVFETRADHSTAKTPMGAFGEKVIPNDIMSVIKTLKEFEMED